MSRRGASRVGGTGSVGDRIEARLAVLARWVEGGVPESHAGRVPTSLARARLWHDPGLGIFPINNPNLFTRTHPDHGSRVARIGEHVERLRRGARPDAGAIPAPEAGRPAPDLRSLLERVASQWHAERQKARALADREDRNARRIAALEGENDRLAEELSILRAAVCDGAGPPAAATPGAR